VFNNAASADSVMPAVERHLKGMVHSEFMPTCITVKREPYCETPGKLKTGLRRFHPYTEWSVFQRDNVCPYTFARTNAEIFAFISPSWIASHFSFVCTPSHCHLFAKVRENDEVKNRLGFCSTIKMHSSIVIDL
jgi:hypothetical protein